MILHLLLSRHLKVEMRVLKDRVTSEQVHQVPNLVQALVTVPKDISELILVEIDACPLLLEVDVDGCRQPLLVLQTVHVCVYNY